MDLSILSIVARKIQQRPFGQGLKPLNIFNWESHKIPAAGNVSPQMNRMDCSPQCRNYRWRI